MLKRIKNLLIVLLLVIAGVVFVLQINRMNAWLLICAYWLALTLKNAIDFWECGGSE